MGKKDDYKWGRLDSENQLADQINEKLKLDKTGNIALLLICIVEFLLLVFFQYLIEVIIFKLDFNRIYAIIFSAIIICICF